MSSWESNQVPLFLCLPGEIRHEILELSIGRHVFYVADDESITGIDTNASTPVPPKAACCALHMPLGCDDSTSGVACRLPGLTATCRLLFHEANHVLYRNTELAFASSEALLKFFRRRPLALQSVQRVRLSCGPAKYCTPVVKANNKAAMRLLTHSAPSLVDLHLDFQPYYNIHTDQQILSTFWYHALCRFRPLLRFTLHSGSDWKGPIGLEFFTEEYRSALQRRVHCLQDQFRLLLCQSGVDLSKLPRGIEREIVRGLKKTPFSTELKVVSAYSQLSMLKLS